MHNACIHTHRYPCVDACAHETARARARPRPECVTNSHSGTTVNSANAPVNIQAVLDVQNGIMRLTGKKGYGTSDSWLCLPACAIAIPLPLPFPPTPRSNPRLMPSHRPDACRVAFVAVSFLLLLVAVVLCVLILLMSLLTLLMWWIVVDGYAVCCVCIRDRDRARDRACSCDIFGLYADLLR